jgi:hypothetical protein
VERGEDQVTGLCDGEGGLDRVEVAHLADEHDVRVLTKDVTKSALERRGVGADLALVHHRHLVRMEVLDRVLDGEDVDALLAVDLVDDRRERGALSRAGRAGDEDEAVRLVRDVGDDGGQTELVVRQDLEGNGSNRGGDGAALEIDVPAEAREVLHAEREVELAVLFERDLLLLRHDRVREVLRIDRRERRQLQRDDLTVDAEQRRRSGRDVHVACALLDHRLEELMEIDAVLGGLGHG